MTNEDLSNKH